MHVIFHILLVSLSSLIFQTPFNFSYYISNISILVNCYCEEHEGGGRDKNKKYTEEGKKKKNKKQAQILII